MQTKFKNLKNDLEDLEGSPQVNNTSDSSSSKSNSKIANYVLLVAFIATLLFYAGTRINLPSFDLNPIDRIVQNLNQPSESLIIGMGEWMEEMGYGELTREELIALRSEGVTATFTSQIRDIGYTDITLTQLVALQNANVSATFARMMKELGYELSIEDLIQLRNDGVTAHFASNMLDLGYTLDELTKENLSRLRSVGVTHQMAQRLFNESGNKASVDELIRYRISNQ